MRFKSGYKYFASTSRGTKRAKKQISNAIQLGEDTLRPKLSNVDYLVLRERRRIIRKWSDQIQGDDLRILDIGGRLQPYRKMFSGRTKYYVATDLQLAGLTDIVANAELLPFVDDAFDLVLCTQVLSYVPQPHQVIDEIYRVTKPGGSLILSAPSFFPEHHDEIWRFLPAAYEVMMRCFEDVLVEPEGNSVVGLHRTANVMLHARIQRYRLRKIAEKTTIPMINLAGIVFGLLGGSNGRCTANYCVLARK